jgi:hypothetical protein
LLDVGPSPRLGTGFRFLASAARGRILQGGSSRGPQRQGSRGVTGVVPRLRSFGECPMSRRLEAVREATIHSTSMISLRRSSDPCGTRCLQAAIEGWLERAVPAETELPRARPARRKMIAGNATTRFCPMSSVSLGPLCAESDESDVIRSCSTPLVAPQGSQRIKNSFPPRSSSRTIPGQRRTLPQPSVHSRHADQRIVSPKAELLELPSGCGICTANQ